MEHLPLPAKPTLAPLKTPYLSKHAYDGGPLENYAARHGWELSYHDSTHRILHKGQLSAAEDAASFLQTWLYFGLLSATLGSMWKPGMQKLFLEVGSNGEKWLNTRLLEPIVADWAGYVAEVPKGMGRKAKFSMQWKRSVRGASSWITSRRGMRPSSYRDEVHSQYEQFRESMNLVQSVVMFARRAQPEALSIEQELALTALAAFLTNTWIRIYQSFFGHNPANLVSLEVGKAVTNIFLRSHMLKMNWCQSDICRIMGRSSSSTIWYYANMQPPRADKDHTSCTEDLCLKCQTEEGTYKLSHREDDCACELIEAKLDDLRPVLESGGVPVVSLHTDDSAKPGNLKVHDSTKVEFVALSHVWAEGLGNKQGNALQSCEVTYLFDLIRKLPIPESQSQHLWIDTICVPVKECDALLNKRAMEKMKNTYETAAAVLVLDAYVQSFTMKDAEPLEAFARVANSSWMQRLWTLQEGRLAYKLYFQFEDGPFELGTIYSALPMSSFPARPALEVSTQITMHYVASRYHKFKAVQKITDVLYEGLLATRNAVMFRSFSNPSDEGLCLATLLDLDLERITHTEEHKRMEALWEMFPSVPVSLVFSRAPYKLPTPGFRWAPSSFCGPVPNDLHEWWAGPDHLWQKLDAIPTLSGLLAQLPGLFLQPVNTGDSGWSNAIDLSPNHAFQLPDGRWIGVCPGESWSQLTKEVQLQSDSQRLALILDADSLTERVNLAFTKSKVITNDIPSRSHLNGVLARITQTENSRTDSSRPAEIHVNGIRHAQVLELDPETSIVLSAGVKAAHGLWDRLEPAQPLTKEVVQVCTTVVKDIMRDDEVMNACRNQRRGAGADDSDDEIMYMLAEMAHKVYLSGYNSAESVPKDCRWYID